MASGQSGRPGLPAHEVARAESHIERGSATTPGREKDNDPLHSGTAEHFRKDENRT